MSADTVTPQSAPTPSQWYEMPERFFARCGPGSVSNSTDPDHPGIYQSYPRRSAVPLAPFAIAQVRRYSGEPAPLYDVVLIDPRTGERIEITRADPGGIAQVINARCGYPRAPLKAAVYSLITHFFWERVDRRR